MTPLHDCRAQAARAQRKAETYKRRMAALGQPVLPAEPTTAYASPFQHPEQGMYQDPHLAAQSYGGAYSQPTLYQDLSGGMYAGAVPLAGALQWEMPQVLLLKLQTHALQALICLQQCAP